MIRLVIAALCLSAPVRVLRAEGGTLTNAADVAAALRDQRRAVGDRFELVGRIDGKNAAVGRTLLLHDATGGTILHCLGDAPWFDRIRPGDLVRATGVTAKDHRGLNATRCETLTVLDHRESDPVLRVSCDDVASGKFDFRVVSLSGRVLDVFRDDIDSRYVFLVVNDGGDSVLVARQWPDVTDDALARYIGATVSASGLCDPQTQTFRRRCHRLINPFGNDRVRILKAASPDPFAVPDIAQLTQESPSRFASLGRHRLRGRVIAVWQGDSLLVQTDSDGICRVRLTDRNAPLCDDFIEAAGLPETDLYHVNLSRAIWRKAEPTDIPRPAARPAKVSDIFRATPNGTVYDATRHGKALRLEGLVRSVPAPEVNDYVFYLETDAQIVRIDASSCPPALADLALGCRIAVTGVCVFDTRSWRDTDVFPLIDGVRLVVRAPDDIRILARPPWWTPGRLLALLGVLLAVLAAFIVRSAIERRIARLRFADRTRLAIELHDSISQNLTSISLQVDAARELLATDRDKAQARLNIASKTIDSCRNELKNCIRDLRDATLDTDDFNAAIRKVLAPVLAEATLTVRFNVPRHALSDNAAHAILCIVRELATNAVRHGHATAVRVAGSRDGDALLFSVTDNGRGFDPANRPGIADGHFGLEGIAERTRTLGGEFTVDSRPGRGTRAVVTIRKLQES